ncbi:serine hydrolase [Bacillus sp. JCM 19041]|uniref:serine hydrolase domain-containing protein n=1 Tax=Bacillus sp. JCM 19041 TaxID=1460637 RepID=UPI000A747EDD
MTESVFFLEEFTKEDKKDITVYQLLTHTSGLPASRDFYKESIEPKEIPRLIATTSLQASPGSKVIYSDLGFMMLYKLIEKIADQRLDVVAKRELFEPLGMKETNFNPNYNQSRFASMEYDEASGSWLRGVVHDENARFMGGISGHAGLFSTATDLGNYVSMLRMMGCFETMK